MIFSAFIKILQLKSDDWVVIILLCLGQHLIQHCVIIQRDEKGYGLTVTGDNPVYVQSVKEGLHDVYPFFLWGEGFFSHTQTHTQNNITEGLGRKIMNFRLKSYLTVTLADKLHLFPLEFCWKLGDGFSVRASCKKFMHFYESSQSQSFLTVNLPDAKSPSTCVVPTVSLCSLAWCIVNLLNSLSPFYTHICCCWIALIIQRK